MVISHLLCHSWKKNAFRPRQVQDFFRINWNIEKKPHLISFCVVMMSSSLSILSTPLNKKFVRPGVFRLSFDLIFRWFFERPSCCLLQPVVHWHDPILVKRYQNYELCGESVDFWRSIPVTTRSLGARIDMFVWPKGTNDLASKGGTILHLIQGPQKADIYLHDILTYFSVTCFNNIQTKKSQATTQENAEPSSTVFEHCRFRAVVACHVMPSCLRSAASGFKATHLSYDPWDDGM